MKNSDKNNKPKVDGRAAAEALEYLFASDYVSKKTLYKENFLRGMFFAVGSVIGATIVISILLWGLSLFNDVPFIGDIAKNIQTTISDSQDQQN